MSSEAFARFARRIEPVDRWSALSDDVVAQLRRVQAELASRVAPPGNSGREHRSPRQALVALFTGASKDVQTVAVEAIANDLGSDLYRVDADAVVSQYVGETEKNLNALFSDAANTGAILFFDEADALFGKRTEVKDAHDRYANIEFDTILQLIEKYGVAAIFATNDRRRLSEALSRRLQFVVDFP